MAMQTLTIVLLLANLAISLLVYRKTRKVHLKAYEVAAKAEKAIKGLVDGFQQGQALRMLEHLLEVDAPLPPMRGWVASPDVLLYLARRILEHRPQTIVEAGSGVSTLVMALACRKIGAGRIVSLDHSESFAEETRCLLKAWGVQEYAEVRVSPVVEREIAGRAVKWYAETPDVCDIDLLFVDGPASSFGDDVRWGAGPLLLSRLSADGVAVVDDVCRPNDRKVVDQWLVEQSGVVEERLYCEKGCVALHRRIDR
jgi:predicted O-methyltransferase YrrM